MNLPGIYSFAIARGKTFERAFVWKTTDSDAPIDLTGKKVRCQIRTADGATGTSTSATLVLNLTNGGGIAITNAVGGEVTLSLTSEQSISICPLNQKTKLTYEIEVYDDSVSPEVVDGFLKGTITVLPETTR